MLFPMFIYLYYIYVCIYIYIYIMLLYFIENHLFFLFSFYMSILEPKKSFIPIFCFAEQRLTLDVNV